VGILIRRIDPHDAAMLRAVRLAALADAPFAFGSTHEREVAFTDSDWADRAAAGSTSVDRATWFAVDEDRVIGVAGGYRERAELPDLDLVSMWIDPEYRGRGVGRQLVAEVIAWARDSGAESLSLWVTRGNEPADRLYVAMGFAETGDHQALPSDPCQDEIRMTLELSG
jgi:GNAT superfamily N-acetyltransferase